MVPPLAKIYQQKLDDLNNYLNKKLIKNFHGIRVLLVQEQIL